MEKWILTILAKWAPEFLKKAWGSFYNKREDSKNASHNYAKPYKKRHGRLQVSCIGMNASQSLDDTYVVVQFLDERRSTKHTSLEAVEAAFRESGRTDFTSTSDECQDGMRVANNEQYLMVLGSPGVGKSTFLRKVGLEALKGEEGNFEHECTPVFLELKSFTEEPVDIEAWITDEFKICGYPYPERMKDETLKSGELLVLFDGLDEVPTVKVNDIINKIRDFVHQYSENRFIVSCRIGAYSGGFTDFAKVEMADFDDAQIQAYINNWFASASHRKMKTAQRCWEALNASDHQATKALAQNPLSLALLCAVYEDSQEFPSNQASLYEKILNIFLKKWAAEKGVRRDPPVSPYLAIPTVKELLSEIAAENFKADRLVFNEDELIDQIQEFYQRRTDISSGFDASGILDAILVEPGLFVEQANGIYSFFHLTFQEYLTANHIIGDTHSIPNLVSNHLHDAQWREVFLLIAGGMREADDLLLAIEAEAIKCINTDGLKRLFQWAEHITGPADSQYTGVIKRKLAIHQSWFLRLLSAVHEEMNDRAQEDKNPPPHFDPDLYLELNRYRNDLYLDLILTRHCNHKDLVIDPDPYLYHGFNLYRNLYHNFYFCTAPDFHVPSETAHFNRVLSSWITLFEYIEAEKIFKGVDLQRLVRRFKQQQAFIKAVRRGKTVQPSTESIHDTWFSVLQITDEMLAISPKELEGYLQYLRAVDLIVACKEGAGGVSPDVWHGIEKRFLTTAAADVKHAR